MCTLVLLFDARPGTPLLLAANRDEALLRPWTPPRLEAGDPAKLVPRDSQAHGTWIGVNAAGLIVAITNRMHLPFGSGGPSRGRLPDAALSAHSLADAEAAVRALTAKALYNPFNLLLAGRDGARALSYAEGAMQARDLDRDAHVITSRHDVDSEVLGDFVGRVRQAAGLLDARAAEASLRACFGEHGPQADDYVVCKHAEAYGTRSMSLIGIHDAEAPTYRYTSGPPCTNPFIDVEAAKDL